MDEQIKAVEEEIAQIIKRGEEVSNNYELAVSVIGVGPVIATDLIIKTRNFKTIDTVGLTSFSNDEQYREQIINNNLQCGKQQNAIQTRLNLSRTKRKKKLTKIIKAPKK